MRTLNYWPFKLLSISRIYILASLVTFPLLANSQAKNSKTGDKSLSVIKNFNQNGDQLTRFCAVGNAIDAHDGEIAYFDGIYYLYGTSYDCGFEWGNKAAPFCGFKTYSSKDLVNWTDRGFLFDAKTPIWQLRCDGKTYGCFRPHVFITKEPGNTSFGSMSMITWLVIVYLPVEALLALLRKLQNPSLL